MSFTVPTTSSKFTTSSAILRLSTIRSVTMTMLSKMGLRSRFVMFAN